MLIREYKLKEFMKIITAIALSCLFLISHPLWAQEAKYENAIFDSNIKSVKFHLDGLYTSYPMIELDDRGRLVLSFDDINGDSRYLQYSIMHCDRNWQPTEDLDLYEYLDGFEENPIENYAFSYGTFTDYTHYDLRIPNEDLNWKKSGNYLLSIFDEDGTVLLTRRFLVVDSKVRIEAEFVRPADAAKYRTHHEIDFRIDPLNTRIVNPDQELTAVVIQNGRWDNAITEVKHKFALGKYYVYDYQDQIVFPAGKEFRNMDITSVKYRSESILEIQNFRDGITVLREKEWIRQHKSPFTEIDLNGKFVIKTDDRFQNQRGSSGLVTTTKRFASFGDAGIHNLESEYVDVIFSIETGQPLLHDVYIFGEFTDWKIQPQFRLTWDDRLNGYLTKLHLKQGFYEYYYVVEGPNHEADHSRIEGDWYETSNDYTILLYYRPFGSRYDQLIGAHSFSSKDQFK